MVASLKLVFPTTINRRNPCCGFDQCIHHEQIVLDTVQNQVGYVGTGVITVRGIEYSVDANLTTAGDQISGNIAFVDRRRRTTVNNLLSTQRTSFPNIPIFNGWSGLRLSGFGDFGALELLDDVGDVGDGGTNNDAVEATFEAIAIQNNIIVSTSKKRFALDGSDPTSWSPLRLESIILTIPNGSITTAIKFEIDDLDLLVRSGAVQIFGKLSSYTSIDSADGNPAILVTKPYSSKLTTSLYNSLFPWSNQWSLIDSLNPSLSLLNSSTMLPYLPSGFHVSVTLKVTGSHD